MSIGELSRLRVPRDWTAVVLVVGALAGLQMGWRWPRDETAVLNQDLRPECPHDGMVVKLLERKGEEAVLQSIPLSGPISDVPEFHDCQRFVPTQTFFQRFMAGLPTARPGKLLYDSLYAIFAAFRLDSLPAVLQGYGSPVATIYSYGGRYDPLGIKPGFNCLVLSGSPGSWKAKMIPQPNPNDSSCVAEHIDESAPGTLLSVWESPVPSLDSNYKFDRVNYPPAARWDWDGEHQYIGIACAMAWCEIGPSDFSPSPVYHGLPIVFDDLPQLSVSPTQRRQATRIKGWYDDQQLDSARLDGRHVVTGIWGWLFPNPDLEDVALDDPSIVPRIRGVWLHVATAVLTADYKGGLRRGVNKIYMCHELAHSARCSVPGTAAFTSPSIPTNRAAVSPPYRRALDACDEDAPPIGGRRWWLIQPEQGEPTYVCVKRRDHFHDLENYRNAHQGLRFWIPATARWRWLLEDVGEWHKCETGCCTGQ
jgi:hypothetical protein